jgi:hypothetical protein
MTFIINIDPFNQSFISSSERFLSQLLGSALEPGLDPSPASSREIGIHPAPIQPFISSSGRFLSNLLGLALEPGFRPRPKCPKPRRLREGAMILVTYQLSSAQPARGSGIIVRISCMTGFPSTVTGSGLPTPVATTPKVLRSPSVPEREASVSATGVALPGGRCQNTFPVTIGSSHGPAPRRGSVVAGLATQGGHFCTLYDPPGGRERGGGWPLAKICGEPVASLEMF